MEFKDFENFIEVTMPPLSVSLRLENLKNLIERRDYHPEKNAYEHIKTVTERLFQTKDVDLIVAGCLHDLFKLDVQRFNPKTGRMLYAGHEDAVASFIQSDIDVRNWITRCGADPDTVMILCKDHMRFHLLDEMKKKKRMEFMARPFWGKQSILGAADITTKEFVFNSDKQE